MRSIRPTIAGNGLAIALIIIFVLPITGILAYAITTPLDDWMVRFGTWLHEKNEWSFSTFDTQERFAKIGFAIRSIFIAVGLSFLYFWLTNWLDGTRTVRNYAFLWDQSALGYSQFRYAMRNSIMWLVLVPTVCISLGLLIAVLADSTRWGIVAKTLIFVPMAISFVGAAVIWRNIFAGGGIQPQEVINGVTPSYQIGLLKHLLGHSAAYNEPLYALKFWGNFFLMWILVWVQTGFAMVIFSAALRGVPEDTIEAAKIDGANPIQMFFRIKLPQIFSTVVVVWTTLVILVLKMFDIPYALSANDDDKLLLATMMENARNNWSVGGDNVENLFAAIAVMLMVTVIPNMIYNARRIRREQKDLGH